MLSLHNDHQQSRRQFLIAGAVTSGTWLLSTPSACAEVAGRRKELAGEVGITTSSFSGHTVASPEGAKGKLSLLELPRFLRDELDMRVIDLNTSTLGKQEPGWLEKVRKSVEDAGCVLTNLKMNQRGLYMASRDTNVRQKAIDEYKRSIDAASQLGIRWARPLPHPETPDMTLHVAAYQELADYAAERNVQMLIENYGWMESDTESVVKLAKLVGHGVAASPDTGNWKGNDLRYEGLRKTFPLAVTCDFKARALGPKGEHSLYDLERCYRIGAEAGFNGPWCLEHANGDLATLVAELSMLRDMLRGWMKSGSDRGEK